MIVGVQMPDRNDEDIPALEVMEAALVESERGLLEKIRDLRIRYGSRKNDQILRVWNGPTTPEEYMALGRFQYDLS